VAVYNMLCIVYAQYAMCIVYVGVVVCEFDSRVEGSGLEVRATSTGII
jgi:hypothetical protein